MVTYPDGPRFDSGERDSAWFVIYDRNGGDRLVLTTGREAALRIQRALLAHLQATNPEAARLFHVDGVVGRRTLQTLYDYLIQHNRNALALAVYPEINAAPSKLAPAILAMLLAAGWNVDPEQIGLPIASGNSLPYNRRAPAPRGRGADIEAIRRVMATSGSSDFTIVRDGRLAQTSRVPVAAAGAALAPGSVRTVERSEDSIAATLPDDPEPTGGSTALLVAGAVAAAAVGLFVVFTRSPMGAR